MTQTLVLDNFPPVLRVPDKKRPGKMKTVHSPLSLNSRAHWRVKRDAKDAAAAAVRVYVSVHNLQPMAPPVVLHPTFVVPDNITRDEDNIMATLKPVVDALVRCGVLFRDDRHHLNYQPPTFRYEKGVRRLELRLEAA